MDPSSSEARSAPLREMDNQLWDAVLADQIDMDAVRAAMDGGANVNYIGNKFGMTLLMVACINGHQDAVDALLDAGADAFAAREDGWTAMMCALHNSRTQIAETLFALYSKNPNCTEMINRADRKGQTCLMLACARDLDGIVEKLILDGIVEKLIHAGADVRATDKNGTSALHSCAALGQEQSLEVLLRAENIEDAVNLADMHGYTPLMLACARNRACMVEKLLHAGADFRATDENGYSALFSCAALGQEQSLEVLLRAENIEDAVNLAGREGYTPLMMACHKDCYGIVKMLLDAGAKVETTNTNGWHALHFAVAEDSVQSLRLLLRAENIDNTINLADPVGTTPLVLACKMDNGVILQMLIDAGAAMDPAMSFDVVIYYGSLRALQVLVGHGVSLLTAQCSLEHGRLQTPRQASKKNHVELAKFILESYVDQAVARVGPSALHSILKEATYSYTDNLLQVHLPVGGILKGHFFRHVIRPCPSFVGGLDEDGNTPLHTACALRAPFDILQMLVECYRPALEITNKRGEVPLHVLVASQPTVETVAFFMDAYFGAIYLSTLDGKWPCEVARDSGAPKAVIFELTTRAERRPFLWRGR